MWRRSQWGIERPPGVRAAAIWARAFLYGSILLVSTGSVLGFASPPDGARGGWGRQPQGQIAGDGKRGSLIAQSKCAACHGADGNNSLPQYPKLAGQNPAYLYAQLAAFKTGVRHSDIMSGIAADLSDSAAADASSFYGQQTMYPDAPANGVEVSAGMNIFRGGSGKVPACSNCHRSAAQTGASNGGMPMMGMRACCMMGMRGSGMMADIPKLNGQHASYIVAQLSQFADGTRRSTVMGPIAAALSETDKQAVAEFLASTP